MKEKETIFSVNGKEYKAIFNLNVMQQIQMEYGTFEEWGKRTDGIAYDENGEKIPLLDDKGKPVTRKEKNSAGEEVEVDVYVTKELDIKALIFGIKEMINEAIDIDNESLTEKQPFVTDRQVGRLITDMGLANATNQLNQTVVESTGSSQEKNE